MANKVTLPTDGGYVFRIEDMDADELVLKVWEPMGSMHSELGFTFQLSPEGENKLLSLLAARHEDARRRNYAEAHAGCPDCEGDTHLCDGTECQK